ncbi:SLOG family protein [Nocardia brasiliensis]|uniref:SLOG family protein n=1 Tax=Nocardia brasiliensis TaxID=37326 RepID=UPI002455A496|nr:SLOG family protein [Nocardia brasiliensis]
MYRVLVTGSRHWTDRQIIRAALAQAWRELQPGPNTLVHGAARGADLLAADIWTGGGLPDEPHPARWDQPCGTSCTHRKERDGSVYYTCAGGVRNQEMVDAGADICLAFPIGEQWSGTRDCMRRAKAAGIPVWVCDWVDAEAA